MWIKDKINESKDYLGLEYKPKHLKVECQIKRKLRIPWAKILIAYHYNWKI